LFLHTAISVTAPHVKSEYAPSNTNETAEIEQVVAPEYDNLRLLTTGMPARYHLPCSLNWIDNFGINTSSLTHTGRKVYNPLMNKFIDYSIKGRATFHW
jgi:hypothetical protein